MEVGDPFFVLIRDTNPLQVFPDHPQRLTVGKPREQLFARLHALKPRAEHRGQFGMQREDILLPVLRRRRGNCDGRRTLPPGQNFDGVRLPSSFRRSPVR